MDYKNLLINYKKILLVINPILPHFTSECLKQLNFKDNIEWPIVEKKYLIKKEFVIVVQINGKKRDLISVEKEIKEEELIKIIHNNDKTSKLLATSKIKKVIYIQNKLINLII